MAASYAALAEAQKETTQQIAALVTSRPPTTPPTGGPPQPRPPRDNSNIQCFRCQNYGHFAKECRMPREVPLPPDPRRQQKPRSGPPRDGNDSRPAQRNRNRQDPRDDRDRCNRCRQLGHFVRNCRACPPRKPCYCGGSHWLYDCPERRGAATDINIYQNQGN